MKITDIQIGQRFTLTSNPVNTYVLRNLPGWPLKSHRAEVVDGPLFKDLSARGRDTFVLFSKNTNVEPR